MPLLPLQTSRLTVRVMRPADGDVLVRYHNDPDVARFQDWELPYPAEAAAAMLADQATIDDVTNGRWVQLALEHQGEVVGDLAVGLNQGGNIATIGYTLAPEWQGRGFAGEAVAALIDGIFANTSVHRIQATLDPANYASMRVIEPLGFRREGLARQSEPIRGEWLDDLRFGLLRSDRDEWLDRPQHRPEVVELAEISEHNLPAVRQLATFEFQQQFVAVMAASLAQALVPPSENGHPLRPWFRAVVADGDVAGFAMLAAPTEWMPQPYLWRFLIDRRHQRRGIGARAVKLLVEHFRAEGHRAMLVSWIPGRGGPQAFYERLGFIPTGEMDEDEVVAKLVF